MTIIRSSPRTLVAVASLASLFLGPGPALAQGLSTAGTGVVNVTAAAEFPSVYFFRGLRQERDPKLTFWPNAEIGVRLYSGAGALRRVAASVRSWNTLHTGSSGSEGGSGERYYEADVSAGARLTLANDLQVGAAFTAYTSPNASFRRVQELSVSARLANRLAPHGLVAFELDGQADEGSEEGIYLEAGIEPRWAHAATRITLSVPVKVGSSVRGYYEGPTGNHAFGFLSTGVRLTVPLTREGSPLGRWSVQGGLDLLTLGATPRVRNRGDRAEFVWVGGVGWSY